MLAPPGAILPMKFKPKHLKVCIALALLCASQPASAESADSAQAKAKLAAVRTRIAALTERLSLELKQRDALNARLREADLAVTEKRRRLDSLHAEELGAERRRNELRQDQLSNQKALQAERAALAAQVRAAYMIGPQEQMKLLLNQTSPVEVGRMLAFYRYFASERAA